MNPRERWLAAMRGEPVDRVPLHLPHLEFETREALEAHPDPLQREVARRVYGRVHYEVRAASGVNRYLITPPQRMRHEAEERPGGIRRTTITIDTPKGPLTAIKEFSPASHTDWEVKYPVETLDDVEKIRSVPWEPPPDLAPPDPEAFPPDFAERGLCRASFSSPMVCVAAMMKYEQFLELCLTEPALVAELTDECLRRSLSLMDIVLARPGIDCVWIGGSEWLTPPMASPALYDRLVQEQERRLIERAHACPGVYVHIHCHGRVRHALGRTIERGADYTEPVEPPPDGDITMAEARALAGGRITLGGNVEARVLANESPETVEAACRAAFEGGKQRFVFRPSEGPPPRLTDREAANWMRMVDVWEELAGV